MVEIIGALWVYTFMDNEVFFCFSLEPVLRQRGQVQLSSIPHPERRLTGCIVLPYRHCLRGMYLQIKFKSLQIILCWHLMY